MADTPQTLINTAEFTVSELSSALKRTVEDVYGHVRLRGEISGFRGPHSSGHCYFALKDDRAKIDAVVWRTAVPRVRAHLVEGLEVVATGKLTTYPGRSSYQIVVEDMEPAGVGALMALLEERRQRLAAEGLFDQARKRGLPYLPGVIGIVTSPTGAVIRDMLHRFAERFPSRVVVWPVRVQGEGSAEEVAAAISGFNALAPGGPVPRPDLIIVARGGGSLEDLWSFNEEAVVRAAAASEIPLISAVGHETDWTLIDHAADQRCPTPTAAAECAVPVRSELIATIGDYGARAAGAVLRRLEALKSELRSAARALGRREDLVALPRQRLDQASARLERSLAVSAATGRTRFAALSRRLAPRVLERELSARRAAFDMAAERLDRVFAGATAARRARLDATAKLAASLSYHGVLERGFALVRTADDKPLRRAAEIGPGTALQIEFADGRVGAVAAGEPGRKRKPPPPPTQRSLFGE